MARKRFARWAPWILAPVLCGLAALIASARGGQMIGLDNRATPIPWDVRFVGALFDYAWWMMLGPFIVIGIRRLIEWRASLVARAAAHVVLGLIACAAYFFLRANVHIPGDTMYLATGWRGFKSVLPTSVGMYLLIASASGLYVMLGRARDRERETAELALKASRLETQLIEAQLGVLRAQLHPHFLFNALHAVSALVDWRPKEARRMLAQLSELLRMALEFSEQTEITLAREFEWLERYVELQQLRFGERLTVNIRVVGDAAGAMVPPLIVQPLVENAIKHGIEPRQAPGTIEVIAERQGKWLRLSVRDDGPGYAPLKARNGVGLRNTTDRLRTLYGDNQQLVIRALETGGTEAFVEFPWKSATAGVVHVERAG
jgi:two-component system, LytTR family, sensor kinase